MEPQAVFLTTDGLQFALTQLEFLRTTKRAEVAEYLHDAQLSGDMIDNPAYDEAKTAHALLEERIYELEQMVSKAQVIQPVSTGVVSLGSVVHLSTDDDREYRYQIVGAFEANPSAGRISNESPVGRALLGRQVSDVVIVSTPGGVREYTILSIE
jgi:transcription elongation factor GreA